MNEATPTRVEERRPRGRRSQAFDVALALLATGTELALLLDDRTASLPAILLTIGAGGALVWRRSVPLIVLAGTLAAATASVSIDEPPGGVSVLIALYTTAALLERRVSLAALVPTVVLVTTLSVLNADGGLTFLTPGGRDRRGSTDRRHLGARRLRADAAPIYT